MDEGILKRFGNSLTSRHASIFPAVKDFVTWEEEHTGEVFQPGPSDDVSMRTYLLEFLVQGAGQEKIKRIRSSLAQFYHWLKVNQIIQEDPFEKYDLELSLIPPQQIMRKHDTFQGTAERRENKRLQALNRLGEVTNRIADVQSMLDESLETLLDVMNLNTAWISLKSDCGLVDQSKVKAPPHGFSLAAARNLPPILEQSNRHFLTRPPTCRCQQLLNAGKLKRGVNIVECSRLQEASRSSEDINTLRFHASVPIICKNQTIGVMNFAAEEWQLLSAADLQFLTAGARQIGNALERAQLYDQIKVQNTHFKHELNMAREVQLSLMPERVPKINGYELAAFWQPASETSGDFYNIYKLPGGRWGFIVADVCDKGAPAALYMALAHGLIREHVEKETSPAAMLTQVNQALYRHGIKTNFVTSFYAILDPKTSSLKYSLAGHPAPLLRKVSCVVDILPGKGTALGILPDAQFEDMEITLHPGESLVAFTDGMTDANNRSSETLDLEQVRKAIGLGPAQAKPMIRHLQKTLLNWVEEAPNFDDITIFVIGRKISSVSF
jgi:serine phosphatase RsbU (regulator of sigma subunit)